jgi:uncharacterized protein (DUF934 family)
MWWLWWLERPATTSLSRTNHTPQHDEAHMQFIDTAAALPPDTLVLDNHADVLALAGSIHQHPSVALQFPKWTDGRAYSQAVLLRGRLRYAGEICATGEVLADMLPLLRRCGFDAVQMRADQSLATAQRALGYFDNHYQTVPSERGITKTGAALGAVPGAAR